MLNMKSKIFKYIYAMLCLLPAIAVGVSCLYVANNDNAYQSYSGTDNISYQQLDTLDSFVIGDTFQFNNQLGTYNNSSVTNTGKILYSSYSNLVTSDDVFEGYLNNADSFIFYYSNTSVSIYFFNNGVQTASRGLNINNLLSFEFVLAGYDAGQLSNNFSFIRYNITNDYQYIDNVFYYSLDKVENSSVFSWVKSNFLYSGVNQFVGIFGGTNSNISFYLTWVLTISLCYLGFEVLMLFINMARNLIHSFTDKDRW